ncbi:MAG: FAD-dependent oxidoreductase [Syntrophales bacterium]|nr:FAD-dependent oxidoreductase [Syntrophales bacterium]
MQKGQKIVIIGGTACGPKTAARARRCDPSSQITIIEQNPSLSSATCGFPYYVGGVITKKSTLEVVKLPYFKKAYGVEIFNNTRAVEIDRGQQRVRIQRLPDGAEEFVPYDKLVIATGSSPIRLNCEGADLKGIYPVWTMLDALTVREWVDGKKLEKAVVIGSGLIGLEVAEALAGQGFSVTMVEALDWMLPKLLDPEIAAYGERYLRKEGVDLRCKTSVVKFAGREDGWVSRVITDQGEIEADLVILAVGTRPNVQLAAQAGIQIGATGAIAVNDRLQTSDPLIYAGGDCVENVNRITGKAMLAPMGSTANKHGRIIGTNIAGGEETFPGVLGTTVAKIFDYNIARVGLTEAQARTEGYDVETCLIPGLDHAAYYPGAKKMLLKVIADKKTRLILGAQAVGPGDVAKRNDVIATAISLGATIDDVANLDLGYAPPYSSAMDPVHNAANVLRNKIAGLADSVTPIEAKGRIDEGEDFVLLDVRSPKEKDFCYIDAPKQTLFIPLTDLRARMEEIPKDACILVYCQTSIRAFLAQRLLDEAGFTDVKFIDGSIAAWPYETLGTKPYLDQSGLPLALDAGL